MAAYLSLILLNHNFLGAATYLCHFSALGTRIIDLVASKLHANVRV